MADRDVDRCPDCEGTGSLPIPGDDGYPRRCYHHNAPAVADDIVTRLAEELDSLKADPQVLSDAIDEIVRLRALVDDYENGINWHTTCTNCAKLMDVNYDQYCEIERLRAAGDALHKALNDNIMWSGLDQINAAWQEARRG